MDKNNDVPIQLLLEKIEKLSSGMQEAVAWAIAHWGLVEWLCKDQEMTDEEIERQKAAAIEKNDDLLLLLLCAVQVFNGLDEALDE